MSVDNVGNMPMGDIDALNEKAKKLEQYLERRKKKEQDLQVVANEVSLLVTDDDYLKSQFDINLLALEEYFPDVYHFFKDYQPRRYVVDIHEGFPNVLDTQTNDYLYPFPPYLMALEQIQRFKLKPTSTRAMFDPDEKNQANFLHSDYMNKFIDIWSQQLAEKGGKQGELPKKVSNALIFGVGAGHHLELLVSQHEIDNLFIIEPELDVFYASLFICNWRYLLDSISDEGRVHLSLGPQDESFFQDLLQRTWLMVDTRQ